MKTKEELNALKEEVETLNKKLAELTEEELTQVTGGKTGINSQISAICIGISDKNGEMKAAADSNLMNNNN